MAQFKGSAKNRRRLEYSVIRSFFAATIMAAFSLCPAFSGGGAPVVSLIGRWDGFTGNYADIWADGDYAYLAHFLAPSIDILDISDPANPTLVMRYDLMPPNTSSSAQDVKTGDGLLFIGLESNGNAVHIVDIRDPENPVGLVDIAITNFNSIHNVFYDQGYLYIADSDSPRVGIVDLTGFDPDNPPGSPIDTLLWEMTGVGSSIVHDITVVNNRLYACAWNSGIWIYDVADVANQPPVFLGSGPGNSTHSAWPTDDGRFVITGEERTLGGIKVYRIDESEGGSALTLTLVDEEVLSINEASSVHNQVTIGNRVYNSWYGAGMRIYDVDPITGLLSFYAGFDNNETNSVWGVYPFLGTDRILISDIGSGLFVLDLSTTSADLNGDQVLNVLDMSLLVGNYGTCSGSCPFDLDANDRVDVDDLMVLMDCWGQESPN